MFRPIAEADRCERYKSQVGRKGRRRLRPEHERGEGRTGVNAKNHKQVQKEGEDYGLNTEGERGGQV